MVSVSVSPIALVNTILKGINFVRNVGNQNQKLQGELDGCFQVLEVEVRHAEWDMANVEGIDEKVVVEMQELLFNIEAFVCDLKLPKGLAAFGKSIKSGDYREKYIPVINSFIESIKSIQTRRKEATPSVEDVSDPPYYAPEFDLVGFPDTRLNFSKLFSPDVDELRVVSIVGCNGVGKTALARAFFEASDIVGQSTSATKVHEANAAPKEDTSRMEFDCKAWVVASKYKSRGDLLNKVMEEVGSTTAGQHSTYADVCKFLSNKRYLIIIDDLQPGGVEWKEIKYSFPKKVKGSKIIVTTSAHSIAKACSSASYYVYPVKCLSAGQSNELFWNTVHGPGSGSGISVTDRPRSDRICEKCGYLPLALRSAANYMCANGNKDLSEEYCEDVCGSLGKYLGSMIKHFSELEMALTQRYDKLSNNDYKNCLLYVSIFPRGHQISSNCLARRLVAEELIPGSETTEEKVKHVRRSLVELIDRTMIEPVVFRNNSEVAKRCKVHVAMFDFIIQKSLSKNLVTLLCEDKHRHGDNGGLVRRLTIQSSTQDKCDNFQVTRKEKSTDILQKSKQSTVRSLAMFSSEIMDLKTFKMMRVLDLDGCNWLDDEGFRGLCELLLLKYLRLRNPSVKKLPEEMKNLKHLQTLDTGDTPEAILLLPLVVIMLPELVYLFGRFELPPSSPAETSTLKVFLEKESQLHTLAGIAKDEGQVLNTIIQSAKEMRKVKLWFNDNSASGTPIIPSPTAAAPAPIASASAATLVIPSPTTAPATRGKSTPLMSTHKLISGTMTRVSLRVPIPKHTASTRKEPSTKLCIKPKKSPHPQPSASTSVPILASDNSVGMTGLQPATLVSSQLRSLYIESSRFCKAFLDSLQAPCLISSIKLRGKLESLPGTSILEHLRNINKLHLSLTGLSCQALSALQNLPHLEYLTITEVTDASWIDCFIVEKGGFPALKVLCFDGPKHPHVEIKQAGAMIQLTSLKLLCKQSPHENGNTEGPPGVNGISHLALLEEVILHHEAADENMESWKRAARCHANMPRVMKQPAP